MRPVVGRNIYWLSHRIEVYRFISPGLPVSLDIILHANYLTTVLEGLAHIIRLDIRARIYVFSKAMIG